MSSRRSRNNPVKYVGFIPQVKIPRAEVLYNAAEDRRLLIRWLVALAVLAVVGLGATTASRALFDSAAHDRATILDDAPLDVDSVFTDRVDSVHETVYDRTPYEAIAKALEKDSVWVDDYCAFEVDDADIAAIKDEVEHERSRIPVVVAFVAETDYDDADGNLNIIAGRIARELSVRPATIVVIGQIDVGNVTTGGSRDHISTNDYSYDFHAQYESTNAVEYVRAVNAAGVTIGDSPGIEGEITNGAPVAGEPDDGTDREPLHYSTQSWSLGIAFGIGIGFALTGLTKLLMRRFR